ncbi:hypothetical protein AB4Z21_38230, partial [Paenibacillus sp. MCAF20]
MSRSKVVNLRVNYRKNPLGIDDMHPRLSWQIIAESRNFIQTAYQIQVGLDLECIKNLVWDSGKTMSNNNVHIEYIGQVLQSRTR